MKKSGLIVLLVSLSMFLQASSLWLRNPNISPDGKEILFTYKGDIYKVASAGGTAERLTTHAAYESFPIWSPDGKTIAFTSDRHGSFDIFVMPATGGAPHRVTTYSGREIPYAFSRDGKEIIYGSCIQDPAESVLFPAASMTELYAVPVNGGRSRQLLGTPAEKICFSASGHSFLYQDKKGGENEWRKHHTSSITRDICLYDIKSGKHSRLTDWQGEDRDPVFGPDQQQVYFLSERGGTFNVWSFPLNQPDKAVAVTQFKTHPVRFLTISANGKLCFTYEGEIYIKDIQGKPEKVQVAIKGDMDENAENYLSLTSGATEASVSSDGKQVAFIVRGEVFVTSSDYSTTKQISRTPEREKWVSFAPDNRTLVYASERNGNWNIYTAKISRPEEVNFSNATLIEEEVLFNDEKKERFAPQFSPDGTELAFVEDRTRLMVMNLKSKKVRQITDATYHFRTDEGFTYQWSPDGKWFVMEVIGNKHDPYTDIAIVRADGGEVYNLTNSGYTNRNPRWVMDGEAILFNSERYGMRNHASWGTLNDVMIVFMNQNAYDKFRLSKEDYELLKEEEKLAAKQKGEAKSGGDKKATSKPAENAKPEKNSGKKEAVIELDGIGERIVRLTQHSSRLGDAILSKSGDKLYYMSAFEGNYDLWETDLRSRTTKILAKLNSFGGALEMDKEGKELFIFGRNLQKITLAGGKQSTIAYRAEMVLDRAAERKYMYDRVSRQIDKRFYVKDLHGVDWKMMTRNYEKFLPSINNNYDFAELLSELLGELNVSHTGGRYGVRLNGDETAELGLLFRWNEKRDGLLIDEVIEKGPFDQKRSKVKAGTILEKIGGIQITKDMDYFPLLNKQSGKKVLVSLYDPSTKERWDEVVVPISRGQLQQLLYKRWVKHQAKEVERLSGGRLGYVHITSMDDESFRSVYSDILGKYNNCEGIVIDTRFNGGGRLHEDIEVLFSGEKYFTQVIRGREACDMPSRRWNKASIMLTCEANYSNAHGTPWVYRFKGIGKLVGMPVPGTMTSVSWETLQDPTLVFGIPIIGYRLPDGSYLENKQLEPDVKVANQPEVVIGGRDEQLETAVRVLLQDLGAAKKK